MILSEHRLRCVLIDSSLKIIVSMCNRTTPLIAIVRDRKTEKFELEKRKKKNKLENFKIQNVSFIDFLGDYNPCPVCRFPRFHRYCVRIGISRRGRSMKNRTLLNRVLSTFSNVLALLRFNNDFFVVH